ncbi:MAG: copper amine oxidase N-terminal domain-containing protein, partial [Bacillota bacterium]|nr:copper amine oxidase N-terminal domain-containing protein [Bacillota bacterium]
IQAGRTASFGEVAVTLTGQNDISNAAGLVIADYKEATFTVESATEDDEFITGLADGYTATISVQESVKDTLIKGRYIDVDLPSWVKIVNGTNVKVQDNNVAQAGTDTSSFRFLLPTNPVATWIDAEERFDFDITFEFVISGIAAIEEPQEMMITIEGAGIDEELSIGTAIAAITVEVMEAETTYLQAGLQNQPATEIIVTENFPGALRIGNLMFAAVGQFENSVRFEDFEVEVIEGDIDLGDAITENDTFGVEITADSEEASVIRFFNVEVTMDRTVPDGEFELDVKGSSVLDDLNFAHDNLPERVYRIEPYFMVGVAPVGPTNTVAFTIGSNAYTVNGQLMQMDVAPYIQSDRMMIPVRYLEDLFGSKPVWNEAERSVSIEYAGQIFEMTIGSPVLTANGIAILELDVSAEITGDRTFVPASRFARAMGVNYTYDEETRTATFN